MIEALLEDIPASLAGGAALVCLTTYPLFRSRSGMLTMQLGAGVAFATHYALLGVLAASAVNVLGCVQTVAALLAARSQAMNRIGYALVPLMVLSGIIFWVGPVSALSVTAMALLAIGRMQQRQPVLRGLLLAGGGFWLLHDVLTGAWIAVVADTACLITGVIGLTSLYFRFRIERRVPGGSRDAAANDPDVGKPALAA